MELQPRAATPNFPSGQFVFIGNNMQMNAELDAPARLHSRIEVEALIETLQRVREEWPFDGKADA